MKILSLFDGMSCAQIAINRLGIKDYKYYAAELDKYAIKVTQANFPDTKQLGDVTQIEGDPRHNIDLLIGGSPCQGFSFAGKQLNFDDPRSKLFFEYVRLLKEFEPRYFLLENVKMKKEYQDVISEALGVEPVEINSALVSAQNRKRLYWTNIPNVTQPEDKGLVLADIIQAEVDPVFNSDPKNYTGGNQLNSTYKSQANTIHDTGKKSPCICAGTHGYALGHIKVGRIVGRRINPETGKRDDYNYSLKTVQRLELRDDEKSGTLTTVQKDNVLAFQYLTDTQKSKLQVADSKHTGSTKILFHRKGYRRNTQVFDPSAKTECIDTAGGGGRVLHTIDEVGIRKLTPIECERLQTVPDDYTNHVSNTQRYKMLGNGFTVDVIAHILKGIIK